MLSKQEVNGNKPKITNMGTASNVDGLGKNRDKSAENEDNAKKQSDKQPAAENLDMMPFSVNKTEVEPAEKNDKNKVEDNSDYRDTEHEKANKWEDHSAKDDKE